MHARVCGRGGKKPGHDIYAGQARQHQIGVVAFWCTVDWLMAVYASLCQGQHFCREGLWMLGSDAITKMVIVWYEQMKSLIIISITDIARCMSFDAWTLFISTSVIAEAQTCNRMPTEYLFEETGMCLGNQNVFNGKDIAVRACMCDTQSSFAPVGSIYYNIVVILQQVENTAACNHVVDSRQGDRRQHRSKRE